MKKSLIINLWCIHESLKTNQGKSIQWKNVLIA